MGKKILKTSALILAICLSFIFVQSVDSALETQLLVDVSPSTDNVPYQQTQWYSFSAIGGKGYCAILIPSSGNPDAYLFDTNFNRVGYSKNTGTTADKVWYGQASSGPMHIGCYGVYNPSSNFTIQVITAPYIKSMSPTSGAAGVLVTLSGYGFGATQADSYVKFGTVQATSYYSWSNTQIKVYVPSGVPGGVIQVVVYVASKASNPMNFTASGASSNGTMWRYDLGRTGNYPNGPTALPLNLKWTFGRVKPMAPFTIANNVAYGGSRDTFYALDANTGILKWSYASGYSFSLAVPAVAGGIVYTGSNGITSGSNVLYALDANTGSIKWQYVLPPRPTSPAVWNGIAYFSAYNKLYALDATNGILRWSYELAITASDAVGSDVTIANGVIYFQMGEKICAFDANSGSVKWIKTLPTGLQHGPSMRNIVAANGILYLCAMTADGKGGAVFALDAATGIVKWQYNGGRYDGIAVANGKVFCNGWSNLNLVALDAYTGQEIWKKSVTTIACYGSPSVSKGLVYVCTYNTLSVYDVNTGDLKWSISAPNSHSSPVIENGKVYIEQGDNNGSQLSCFGQ